MQSKRSSKRKLSIIKPENNLRLFLLQNRSFLLTIISSELVKKVSQFTAAILESLTNDLFC